MACCAGEANPSHTITRFVSFVLACDHVGRRRSVIVRFALRRFTACRCFMFFFGKVTTP